MLPAEGGQGLTLLRTRQGLSALTCNTFRFNPITEPCLSVTELEEPFAQEPRAATGLGRLFVALLHGGRSQGSHGLAPPTPPHGSSPHLSRLLAFSLLLRPVLGSWFSYIYFSCPRKQLQTLSSLKLGFCLSVFWGVCVCKNTWVCECSYMCVHVDVWMSMWKPEDNQCHFSGVMHLMHLIF